MRECSICPGWVIRCAHWEGDLLVLSDGFSHLLRKDCICGRNRTQFAVGRGSATGFNPCDGGCGGLRLDCYERPAWFPTLATALEEFHCREEALIADPQWTRK